MQKKLTILIITLVMCLSGVIPVFANGITNYASLWGFPSKQENTKVAFGWEVTDAKEQASPTAAPKEETHVGPHVTVLMYHKLSNNKEEWSDFCISPEMFENDIKKLKEAGYIFLKPQQMKGNLTDGKYVLITFDDGYESDYKLALSILEKNTVPATFFIIADNIGTYEYMTKEQLKSLSDSPYAVIGSHSDVLHSLPHSVVNRNLTYEDFADFMVSDFVNSINLLEQITSKDVTCLSYPNGLYTAEIDKTIKEVEKDIVSFSSDLKTVALPFDNNTPAGRFNRYFNFDVNTIK